MTPDRRFTACAACRRQYDVTDHLPGRRIRCNCGEVFTVVHHRPHSPKPVRCSGCGGALAAGATKCAYCSVEVTVDERRLSSICPLCFARMRGDARFCMECGVAIEPQRLLPIPEGSKCPRCRQDLLSRVVGPVSVIECTACFGIWATQETFERAIRDAEAGARLAKEFGPSDVARSSVDAGRVRYLECVVCRELMNRKNFALSSGVIIDVCRAHGVWLDADELAKIVSFVRDGGLIQAREREVREIERRRKKKSDAAWEQAGPMTGPSWNATPVDGGFVGLDLLDVFRSIGRRIRSYLDD